MHVARARRPRRASRIALVLPDSATTADSGVEARATIPQEWRVRTHARGTNLPFGGAFRRSYASLTAARAWLVSTEHVWHVSITHIRRHCLVGATYRGSRGTGARYVFGRARLADTAGPVSPLSVLALVGTWFWAAARCLGCGTCVASIHSARM